MEGAQDTIVWSSSAKVIYWLRLAADPFGILFQADVGFLRSFSDEISFHVGLISTFGLISFRVGFLSKLKSNQLGRQLCVSGGQLLHCLPAVDKDM